MTNTIIDIGRTNGLVGKIEDYFQRKSREFFTNIPKILNPSINGKVYEHRIKHFTAKYMCSHPSEISMILDGTDLAWFMSNIRVHSF